MYLRSNYIKNCLKVSLCIVLLSFDISNTFLPFTGASSTSGVYLKTPSLSEKNLLLQLLMQEHNNLLSPKYHICGAVILTSLSPLVHIYIFK